MEISNENNLNEDDNNPTLKKNVIARTWFNCPDEESVLVEKEVLK